MAWMAAGFRENCDFVGRLVVEVFLGKLGSQNQGTHIVTDYPSFSYFGLTFS